MNTHTHISTLSSLTVLCSLCLWLLQGCLSYFIFPWLFISLSGTPPFQRNCFHISLSATLGVQAEGVSKCIFAGSASARTGGRLCGESSELSTRDPSPAEPTKRQTGTTAWSSAAEEVILSHRHTHTHAHSLPLLLSVYRGMQQKRWEQ